MCVGIGFETALFFARNGDKVFASVKNLKHEGVEKLQYIAHNEGLDLEIVEIDVTQEKQISQAVISIHKKATHIDVLINNAGIGYIGPVEAFSIEEIKKQFDINVFGTLQMILAVTPYMRDQKRGVILNISSINGLVAFPFWGIYASSKFAIEAFTESLRFELEPFGVTVALIEPGSFSTRFGDNRKLPSSQEKKGIYKKRLDKFFGKFDTMSAHAKNNTLMRKLINPKRVAKRIYTVAQQAHPHLHNRIGVDAHAYFWAKKCIPTFIWNHLLKGIYD